jgi:hypothetical protein
MGTDRPTLDVQARRVGRAAGLGLASALDGLTHLSVLAFAAWTLIYDLGLAAHLGTTSLLAMWAVCVVVIIVGLVRFPVAAFSQPAPGRPRQAEPAPVRRRALAVVGILLALGAGAAAGLHSLGLPWVWTPLLGLASVAAAGMWLLTGDAEPSAVPAAGRTSLAGSVLAACVATAAAIFSLYIVRPTPDDVYYVSRSVWTAQHGQIPVRDVIFTSQAIKPITGEVPISSIEVFNGALARVLGMPAAGFSYEIVLPVLTFISVWAVWMLIRRWAPGRYALCFVVAMVYLAWDGGNATFGSFHLMMWQGKAGFVSAMVPLLYFYLTDWAENPSRRGLVLVIASGVAAAGLSSVAVYVVPLVTAAVAVPLLCKRMFKEAFGAGLVSAYPVAAGLVAVAVSPLGHIPNALIPAPTAWTWVMQAGLVGAVSGVALWAAPWLARREVPALMTAGIAGMAGVLVIPSVMVLLGGTLGISPVLWRLLWVVPGPVLVGLLAAVPLPSAKRFLVTGRILSVIPAGALAAVLVVFGVVAWSHQNGATIASHPSWKVKASWLVAARGVVHTDHVRGAILSTGSVMEVVPLLTTRVQAVNARSYYLAGLPAVGRQFITDRRLLTRLADGGLPLPRKAVLQAALNRVGVGYACVWFWKTKVIRLLVRTGFTYTVRFGNYQCLQR